MAEIPNVNTPWKDVFYLPPMAGRLHLRRWPGPEEKQLHWQERPYYRPGERRQLCPVVDESQRDGLDAPLDEVVDARILKRSPVVEDREADDGPD